MVVLKELIFNSFYFGQSVIFNSGFERTVVVLKELL